MKFLQKRQNERSFTKSDYVVLSYEQLLQVNGAGGSSSGGGGPSGPSGNLTDRGYPSSTDLNTGNSSSSSNNSSSGTISKPTSSSSYNNASPNYQTPVNSDDYHCDIIAYNEAVKNGASNPGNWDGNTNTVNQIYHNNYEGQGSSSPSNGDSGYVFYDLDNNGTMDHMEYYESGSGSNYTVYRTDGIIEPPEPTTYDSNTDSNGSAGVGSAIFVPIN